MIKKLTIIVFFLLHGFWAMSQDNHKKIEEVKVAYMTHRLSLSHAESRKFWPVYNNYIKAVKEARAKYSNEITFDEVLVGVKKQYSPLFLQILKSPVRVNNVFSSETAYRGYLTAELQKRKS